MWVNAINQAVPWFTFANTAVKGDVVVEFVLFDKFFDGFKALAGNNLQGVVTGILI